MNTAEYIFAVNPTPAGQALPQISRALEKRTELISRERFPGLWSQTDRLNARNQGRTRSRLRTRFLSILCLALGIFLFVPGLMKPQELQAPLLMGALAVGAGIGGLWRSRKHKKSAYDKAAEKLLTARAAVQPGQHQVQFSAECMTVAGPDSVEEIPYDRFDYVIETADLLLLTFGERVLILMKDDLQDDSIDDFCSFLVDHVQEYELIDILD